MLKEKTLTKYLFDKNCSIPIYLTIILTFKTSPQKNPSTFGSKFLHELCWREKGNQKSRFWHSTGYFKNWIIFSSFFLFWNQIVLVLLVEHLWTIVWNELET